MKQGCGSIHPVFSFLQTGKRGFQLSIYTLGGLRMEIDPFPEEIKV